ncbi:hypothetical protein [Geodermatophilus sp. SYSU D01105]
MRADEGRPATGRPSESATARRLLAVDSTAVGDTSVLFDAVVDSHTDGRTTTLISSEYVTGPGPRPATVGPEGAGAPDWWWREAEAAVRDLLDRKGTVTSDDLHERFPDEPSASGAAIGGLFARLARAGALREVGMVKSQRPEARRRRIILWGRP